MSARGKRNKSEENGKSILAACQMEPKIGKKQDNLCTVLEMTEAAAKKGAKLVAFPELALTGDVYNSLAEVQPVVETIPGPSTKKISAKCREYGVYVVVGLIEVEDTNYYNVSVLCGPEGINGKYRKTHLPFFGVDRILVKGNLEYTPFSTELGKIGLVVCYDMRFPEIHRVLALKEADIIVNITNLPQGCEFRPNFVAPTRAVENHVYYVSASRIGTERGVKFIGRSQIIDVTGEIIVEASTDRQEIIYAAVDVYKARTKRIVEIPGEYEIDLFGDRRPELYSFITEAGKDIFKSL